MSLDLDDQDRGELSQLELKRPRRSRATIQPWMAEDSQ